MEFLEEKFSLRNRTRKKEKNRFVSTITEVVFRKPRNLHLGHTVLERPCGSQVVILVEKESKINRTELETDEAHNCNSLCEAHETMDFVHMIKFSNSSILCPQRAFPVEYFINRGKKISDIFPILLRKYMEEEIQSIWQITQYAARCEGGPSAKEGEERLKLTFTIY